MVETTAQIERHIAATRGDLGDNLDALERKIQSATDWREHFQRSPAIFLAVTFVGGALLAVATGPRHGPRETRGGRHVGSALRPRRRDLDELVTMLDDVKGVLIGMTAIRLRELVGQVVPGFREEFERRQAIAAPGAAPPMGDTGRGQTQ